LLLIGEGWMGRNRVFAEVLHKSTVKIGDEMVKVNEKRETIIISVCIKNIL